MYNITRPKSQYEIDLFQSRSNIVYDDFTRKAAEDRGMELEDLLAIASGRVWTGLDAKDNGLVDVLGDLEDALAIAAEKAGLEEYRASYYPVQKPPFEELMEKFLGETEERYMKTKLGELYPLVKQVKDIQRLEGIQARMPYGMELKF
jgi:protease-4